MLLVVFVSFPFYFYFPFLFCAAADYPITPAPGPGAHLLVGGNPRQAALDAPLLQWLFWARPCFGPLSSRLLWSPQPPQYAIHIANSSITQQPRNISVGHPVHAFSFFGFPRRTMAPPTPASEPAPKPTPDPDPNEAAPEPKCSADGHSWAQLDAQLVALLDQLCNHTSHHSIPCADVDNMPNTRCEYRAAESAPPPTTPAPQGTQGPSRY